MCENCGDPNCIVQFYDLEGNEIEMQEWKDLVETFHDPEVWAKQIRIAWTTMDQPPVEVMTAWAGVTRGEKPPRVWATTVLARKITPYLLEKIIGAGDLIKDFRELGVEHIEISQPLAIGERVTYATKAAALAGHDQKVAEIKEEWHELHVKHGVPEQLSLEPDLESMLHDDAPAE